jgi:hypothetical protein
VLDEEVVVGLAVAAAAVVVSEVVDEVSNPTPSLASLRHHNIARLESTRISSMFIHLKRISIAKTRP